MEKTILLVDDVQMYLEIEKDFLKYTSARILTARDGAEALDIVKTQRPDIIFMDLQMPRMDGIACCKALKSNPEFFTIPVIMLTLQGKKEDEAACYSAGCNHFMTKPLDRARFLDITRRFIPNADRREKRVPTRMNGTFRVNDAAQPCVIHDLSIEGAYIEADYFGIPGRVIQISFMIPDGTIIECNAKIAWVNRIASTYPVGFGVKLAMLPKGAKDALNKFVSERP